MNKLSLFPSVFRYSHERSLEVFQAFKSSPECHLCFVLCKTRSTKLQIPPGGAEDILLRREVDHITRSSTESVPALSFITPDTG